MTHLCVHHEGQPGVAICSVCRQDICLSCHRSTLSGYAICETCELAIQEVFTTPWERATLIDMPVAFAKTAWAVLKSPLGFYRTFALSGRLSRAVGFGALCYAIGSFSAWVWRFFLWDEFGATMSEQATKADIDPAVMVPVFFASLPAIAVFAFLLHWVLFHFALRLVGEKTTWRSTGYIVSYSATAFLFQVIPPIAGLPIGHFLSVMSLVHLETTAVRGLLELSIWRSMAVVLLAFFATVPFMM